MCIPGAGDVRGDYLLRGQLYDFCEVSGKGLVARVAFEFDLQDSKTGVTVWTASYSHDEPAAANEVLSGRRGHGSQCAKRLR